MCMGITLSTHTNSFITLKSPNRNAINDDFTIDDAAFLTSCGLDPADGKSNLKATITKEVSWDKKNNQIYGEVSLAAEQPDSISTITSSTSDPFYQEGFNIPTVVRQKITTNGQSTFYNYNVTTLTDNAFKSAIHLGGDLTISNSITSVGTNAFDGCSGLKKLVINANMDNWVNTFVGCSALNTITINGNMNKCENCFPEYPDSVSQLEINRNIGKDNIDCFGAIWNTIIIGETVTNIAVPICLNLSNATNILFCGPLPIMPATVFNTQDISKYNAIWINKTFQQAYQTFFPNFHTVDKLLVNGYFIGPKTFPKTYQYDYYNNNQPYNAVPDRAFDTLMQSTIPTPISPAHIISSSLTYRLVNAPSWVYIQMINSYPVIYWNNATTSGKFTIYMTQCYQYIIESENQRKTYYTDTYHLSYPIYFEILPIYTTQTIYDTMGVFALVMVTILTGCLIANAAIKKYSKPKKRKKS